MTRDHFNSKVWCAGETVIYKGETCSVVSLDFEEGLVGICDFPDSGDICWKRCESVEGL